MSEQEQTGHLERYRPPRSLWVAGRICFLLAPVLMLALWGCQPRDKTAVATATSAATTATATPPAPASSAIVGSAVVDYFAKAEVQAETDMQRAELRRALTDLLNMGDAELRAARYASFSGQPGQRDLVKLLHGHVVPASPETLTMDLVLATRASPQARAAVKGLLDGLDATPKK
jgi:hypothetical protein